MRVLLTGGSGQLGRELTKVKPAAIELLALDRAHFNLARSATLTDTIERLEPDVILNAAAFTAVDRAEAEAETAFAVNAQAVGILSRAAKARGARFVHISTDFVFDGKANSPYRPSDPTAPVSVYGRSKLKGESDALTALPTTTVVRTSWLYSSHGRNFVTNMLRMMGERDRLTVVMDQLGSPTWTLPLAEALWSIVSREDMPGLWHWCDGGTCSWYEFACAIQDEGLSRRLLSNRIPIDPVLSAQFPTAATRPAMSALDDSATREALGIDALPWRVALGRMLDEMTAEGIPREAEADG